MKIKTLLCSVPILFILLGIHYSCSSSEEPQIEPHLSIPDPAKNVEASGGDVSFKIEANVKWIPEIPAEAQGWLSVKSSDIERGVLIFTATANTAETDRTAEVPVKLEGYNMSAPIKITQTGAAKVYSINATPSVIPVPEEGGEYTVNVEYTDNVSWEYELEEGITWILEKAKTDNSVTFTITRNTGNTRNTVIIFKDKNGKALVSRVNVSQVYGSAYDPENPTTFGYTLQGTMEGDESLIGKPYTDIHTYMRKFGWDYSEHPNSSTKDHNTGVHCENVWDNTLKQYVFKFTCHAEADLDGDRGSLSDRQRNEMKTQTSSTWYKLNGNYDEWQVLEWKFMVPKGFRPSTSFCHIHQLKAQEGNNGAPLITITPRGNNNGTNRRMQVIHTGDKSSTNKGTIVDNVPLEEFEDEWVKVQEEVHYSYNGYYRIKITRIRDNKVLINCTMNEIDMWRTGATNIRNKFGIYRSFGKTLSGPDDRPSNGIKDESLFLGDFSIYEKNTNPKPGPID